MTIQIDNVQVADRDSERPRPLAALQPEVGAELDTLVGVIEERVIPTITRVHGVKPAAARRQGIVPADVDNLVRAVLGHHRESPKNIVEQCLESGASDEQICLDLLAPAAVRLGGDWLSDDLSFYQVTTGSAHLQSLLRGLDRWQYCASGGAGYGHTVVLCGAPGEQHLFGLAMLDFFFRRDGWDTISAIGLPFEQALDVVRRSPCDLIAFSCSCSDLLDGLASAIQLTRSESIENDTSIMVGGQLFSDEPELVSAVGADVSARDAAEAVKIARSLAGIERSAGP